MSDKQENAMVKEKTLGQEFTVGISDSVPAVNENLVSVETLERCFNERIDRKTGIIVDTVEDRIQNAILTAIDNIISPKNVLAIRSKNASSGRDATSVMANLESGEHIKITAPSESVSEGNNYYTTCVKYEWGDSKQNSGRGKWIVRPRYAFWPATT